MQEWYEFLQEYHKRTQLIAKGDITEGKPLTIEELQSEAEQRGLQKERYGYLVRAVHGARVWARAYVEKRVRIGALKEAMENTWEQLEQIGNDIGQASKTVVIMHESEYVDTMLQGEEAAIQAYFQAMSLDQQVRPPLGPLEVWTNLQPEAEQPFHAPLRERSTLQEQPYREKGGSRTGSIVVLIIAFCVFVLVSYSLIREMF